MKLNGKASVAKPQNPKTPKPQNPKTPSFEQLNMDFVESSDDEGLEIIEKIFIEIELGNLETVSHLIDEYPEYIDAYSTNNWTPVMMAARYGHLDIVKFLISRGCSLENKKGNYEIMHTACMAKDIPMIKYLIDELKLPFNSWNKPKAPFDFLVTDKEDLEIILKKFKPIYSIEVPKTALDYLNGWTKEFDKK